MDPTPPPPPNPSPSPPLLLLESETEPSLKMMKSTTEASPTCIISLATVTASKTDAMVTASKTDATMEPTAAAAVAAAMPLVPSSAKRDESNKKEQQAEDKGNADADMCKDEVVGKVTDDDVEADDTPPRGEVQNEANDDEEATTTTGDGDDQKGKRKNGISLVAFPKFEVFWTKGSCLSSSPTQSFAAGKRCSPHSCGFARYDSCKPAEMSPEVTLIEFISTSAAFHGVKKQDLKQLEWDILKVFTNNIMPANAAAWYMAKRRFYVNNVWENQLLPFLLKKYPDKFYVRNQTVEFLDTYAKDVTKRKMTYMVNQGLYAYFSHKADEYGVYFFDPYYYENTEPFHASIRVAANSRGGHRSKLIPAFFNQYKKQFYFIQHSPYLVTISKVKTKVKVNTTGIIVRMLDHGFGLIQFPCGPGTEKALFSVKSLYTDGWQYQGDPLRLDAVQFDGYRIPGGDSVKNEEGFTWYAVLVWGGRKPSPKFCVTRDDLAANTFGIPPENESSSSAVSPAKSLAPDESMVIGEILEIRKNGAIVSMQSKGSDEKAFIPGWRRENLRKKGYFLTTTQGVGLAIKDLIGYYSDPNATHDNYSVVGHQVIVLKHSENRTLPTLVEFGSPNTRNGIQRQFAMMNGEDASEMKTWKMLKQFDSSKYKEDEDVSYSPDNDSIVDSSEYESFNEADDVSDEELCFLRDGIMDLISIENNGSDRDWRLIAFLQKVMVEANNAINTRNLRKGVASMGIGPLTPSSQDSGVPASQEVTPTTERTRSNVGKKSREAFWRMRKAFRCLEAYNSDDDPSYEPSDHVDNSTDDDEANTSVPLKNREKLRRRTRRISKQNSLAGLSPVQLGVPWTNAIITGGLIHCPHTSKWVVDQTVASDPNDEDYVPLQLNYDESESEDITDGELNGLTEDMEKDVTEFLEVNVVDPQKDERKKTGSSYNSERPSWLKYLLEKNEESAEYDSNVDEEYYPQRIYLDSDPDYDEYSNDEISDKELELLREEFDTSLTSEFVGPCACGNPSETQENGAAAAAIEAPQTEAASSGDSETPEISTAEKKSEQSSHQLSVEKPSESKLLDPESLLAVDHSTDEVGSVSSKVQEIILTTNDPTPGEGKPEDPSLAD